MSVGLRIKQAGPGLTIQDQGRPGYLAQGISRGGAADQLALAEGAALLNHDRSCAALEMPGSGGSFEAAQDLLIALTGAPMKATIDGERAAWNATHKLPKGAVLTIGGASQGNYGYLHVKGGFQAPEFLGARSTHLVAAIGRRLEQGDELEVSANAAKGSEGLTLPAADRFGGGELRVVTSLQTDQFDEKQRAAFETTSFSIDPRSNRMGISLGFDGDRFNADAGLSILSEIIVPGDVQIAGDGTPYILMNECQTTGGYPRIATVIPSDLPRVAQTRVGESLRFSFISLEDAVEIERKARTADAALSGLVRPLIRDPRQMQDLLSYQLISGVTAGEDGEAKDYRR